MQKNLDFGKRVRERRKKLGMTQQELADIVGAAPARISTIENGRIPSGERIIKLATVLGVSTDWLLGRENEQVTRDRQREESMKTVQKLMATMNDCQKIMNDCLQAIQFSLDSPEKLSRFYDDLERRAAQLMSPAEGREKSQ